MIWSSMWSQNSHSISVSGTWTVAGCCLTRIRGGEGIGTWHAFSFLSSEKLINLGMVYERVAVPIEMLAPTMGRKAEFAGAASSNLRQGASSYLTRHLLSVVMQARLPRNCARSGPGSLPIYSGDYWYPQPY